MATTIYSLLQASHPDSALLGLPDEILIDILKMLLKNENGTIPAKSESKERSYSSGVHPQILSTCQRLANIGIEILYSGNTMNIDVEAGSVTWDAIFGWNMPVTTARFMGYVLIRDLCHQRPSSSVKQKRSISVWSDLIPVFELSRPTVPTIKPKEDRQDTEDSKKTAELETSKNTEADFLAFQASIIRRFSAVRINIQTSRTGDIEGLAAFLHLFRYCFNDTKVQMQIHLWQDNDGYGIEKSLTYWPRHLYRTIDLSRPDADVISDHLMQFRCRELQFTKPEFLDQERVNRIVAAAQSKTVPNVLYTNFLAYANKCKAVFGKESTSQAAKNLPDLFALMLHGDVGPYEEMKSKDLKLVERWVKRGTQIPRYKIGRIGKRRSQRAVKKKGKGKKGRSGNES